MFVSLVIENNLENNTNVWNFNLLAHSKTEFSFTHSLSSLLILASNPNALYKSGECLAVHPKQRLSITTTKNNTLSNL